jgi:hypothetical protein
MKTIEIEKTESKTVTTVIEIPQYFSTLIGWFHKIISPKIMITVTEFGVKYEEINNGLKYIEENIKPIEPEVFYLAFANKVSFLTQESGIEHLTLIDNTSNPES